MRRLLIRALALLMLVGALWAEAPGVSTAQVPTTPQVALRLLSQTVWNGPTRPLELSFSATNESSGPLDALSLVLSIGTPARSRTAYELSLRSDATTFFLSLPFPQKGSLMPGATRVFTIVQSLDTLTQRNESALYPLKVLLLSADVPVATLRTPLVFLIEHPKVPLNFAWTWVLAEPLQLDPEGVLGPGPIEGDIAPGGRIDSIVMALDVSKPGPVDVVVSSVLVEELTAMAKGYRSIGVDGKVVDTAPAAGGAADAARILAALRRIAGSEGVEIESLPYGDPSLPALIQARLSSHIPQLVQQGMQEVAQALGATVRNDVARPLGSQLTSRSLAQLARLGARTVLVDAGFVPTAPGLQFSPAPIAALGGGGQTVTAILPDTGVATVAASYSADPILAARAALGELAAIWLEFPGTASRGAAVLFPESSGLPSGYFHAFADLVRGSPWLAPRRASDFESVLLPAARQALPPSAYPVFAPDYIDRLTRARALLANFALVAPTATPLVQRQEDLLLLAESATFISNAPLGDRFPTAVRGRVESTYDQVHIRTTSVTLTSHSGVIPLTLLNDSGLPLKVILRFVSDRRLVFVGGNDRPLVLDARSRTMTFPVRAETTGRFPIKVTLETPTAGGRPDTIAETQMIVRSTAYNKVALIVTIGAAIFLLAWWGRRFLPRRRS